MDVKQFFWDLAGRDSGFFLFLFFNLYLSRKIPLRLKTSFSRESWPRGSKNYTVTLNIYKIQTAIRVVKTITNKLKWLKTVTGEGGCLKCSQLGFKSIQGNQFSYFPVFLQHVPCVFMFQAHWLNQPEISQKTLRMWMCNITAWLRLCPDMPAPATVHLGLVQPAKS